MKQTIISKTEKLFSAAFLFLTAGIVIGIFYFNFNGICFYDGDMYSDALIAKEMWAEKTLFPENWVFGNQFYVAATPVLAALMYGIVGDSILAMSVASCLMTVFTLLSFVYCMKEAVEKKYLPLGLFCISGAAIICTGACTDIYGWQIFYTMSSYYASYFIGILLTMGVWLKLKKNNKVNPLMVILVLILNLALGMNSLRQTLTGCLPLVALECLLVLAETIRQKKFIQVIRSDLKRILFSLGILLSNLIGVVLIRLIDVNSDPIIENAKISLLPSEIGENFVLTLKKIASLLELSVLYTKHVSSRSLLIIAVTFFLIVIAAFFLIIKNKDISPLTYLIAFSFISFMAMAFTGVFILRVRQIYFFIWFFMLTCCIVYLAVKFKGKFKVCFLIIVMLCGMLNCSYSFLVDYQKYRSQHEVFEKISNELTEDGIEYIYAGVIFPKTIAAYSSDQITHAVVYWDFNKETGTFTYPVWYIQSKEYFEHTNDKNAIFAMTEFEWQNLPNKVPEEYIEELTSCLELYKSFEGIDGETYYFYRMKKDIISDFGVTANVKDPHINQWK